MWNEHRETQSHVLNKSIPKDGKILPLMSASALPHKDVEESQIIIVRMPIRDIRELKM